MTHLSVRAASFAAASCLALMLAGAPADAQAQCSTCATPTVAYAPVVAAPAQVVVVQRPGLFDRWRMRRWGVAYPVAAAPTYTAAYGPAYVPAYTAAYAPAYTAAYAPAYTAAYAPAYTAAYAPAYTAAYAPAVSPYVTAYAPLQRVYRPAVLETVAAAPACSACASYAPAPAPCAACAVEAPCSSCAAGAPTGYVDQAAYAAPSSACSSCAGASGTPTYASPQGGYPFESGTPSNPPTPQPMIPTPAASNYQPITPGPEADASGFAAPPLLSPPITNPTASRPSVDIHTAVYRRPATAAGVSTTVAKPVTTTAIDASSWETVPAK